MDNIEMKVDTRQLMTEHQDMVCSAVSVSVCVCVWERPAQHTRASYTLHTGTGVRCVCVGGMTVWVLQICLCVCSVVEVC